MNSPALRSYPKTNALGSAKVDCHTCLRLRQRCDRQRPKCGPCIKDGRSCGGFVMDIVWKSDRKPRQAQRNGTVATTPVANEDDTDPEVLRQQATTTSKPIRFVQNGAKRRRKTNKLPDVMNQFMTIVHQSPRQDREPSEQLDASTHPGAYDNDDLAMIHGHDESIDITMDSHWAELSPGFLDAVQETPSPSFSSPYGSPSEALMPFGGAGSPSSDVQWLDSDTGQVMQLYGHASPAHTDISFPLSPGPLFSSPTQKAAAILDMYDQEFCILPLTADCASNPFRIRQDSCEGSAFLLHAMLAISSQHLAKKNKSVVLATEMWNHHATALRLFSQALDHVPVATLLDTLLLLVNFEATQSASSTWAVHISGAQKLLESMGGVKVCQKGSRARAQVAMIVWWDVTVAMISRKRPLLDLGYLENLILHGEEDSWTFFTLNGCPAELVMFMARLSILASTFEKVQALNEESPWVTFSTVPVEAIIAEVTQWTNPEGATAESIAWTDDNPEKRLNRFHCVEAWRNAILLYAYRVFSRPQTTAGLRSITYLARVVLDHVRCIPDTDVVQKQTLLPVFLAASETGDESTRDFVRNFCGHWTATARYSMFGTVGTLLENIWAGWDVESRHVHWWGTIVENSDRESPGGEKGLVSELLLG